MQENNYTILYVEDDEQTRANIASFLRMKYKRVLEAKDGVEAYELYLSEEPDLILTDIEMPNMNGFELIKKVRDKNSDIPIVITSAYSNRKKLLTAVKLNIVDYIIKPISRSSLREVLETATKKIVATFDISAYNKLLEAIVIFDTNNNLLECNDAFLKLFGYEKKDEVLGVSAYFFAALSSIDKIDMAFLEYRNANVSVELVRKDKTTFVATTKSQYSIINNKKVRIVSIVDISQTIKDSAIDFLTSLQTRNTLELEFKNILQSHERDSQRAAAIFVDVDNFKTNNDSLGHQFGDQVLKKIANILVNGVRRSDLVVRWGGDEFLILLFNTTRDQMKKVTENLRHEINNLCIGACNNFTCSFGIDMINRNDTLNEIITRVDKSLISAKQTSKNCAIEYAAL